uniref:C2 domain-containing protein n=1 Tax=Ananas comosus var. bracteatus TaxID=296719 RepID=A0A6V7NML6_ANACO|nr:unnamed protein product [Ananas comosus var. bracteatus]
MAATMRKLVVEVVEARNLLPKDGTGTSSPYVRVDFDGQRRKTRTAQRDLNPTWNEALEFDVAAAADLDEPLEVDVFHDVGFAAVLRAEGRGGADALPAGEEELLQLGQGGDRLEGVLCRRPRPGPRPAPAAAAAAAAAAEPDNSAANDSSNEPDSVHENCNEPAAPPPAEAPNAEKPAEAPPAEADGATAAAGAATSELEETAPAAMPTENSEKPAEESDRQNMEANEEAPPEPIAAAAATETRSEPEKEAAGPEWAPQPRRLPPRRMKGMGAEIAREGPAKYDLVDKMQYLFVRVVRARGLPAGAAPRVRVAAHGRRASTREARRAGPTTSGTAPSPSPANPTPATPPPPPPRRSRSPCGTCPRGGGRPRRRRRRRRRRGGGEASPRRALLRRVRGPPAGPTRQPPGPTVVPPRGPRGGGGQLMLATWIGTQADESFADAWKADAPPSAGSSRAKVYVSPKLWYLRVTVIEAQDALASPLPPRRATPRSPSPCARRWGLRCSGPAPPRAAAAPRRGTRTSSSWPRSPSARTSASSSPSRSAAPARTPPPPPWARPRSPSPPWSAASTTARSPRAGSTSSPPSRRRGARDRDTVTCRGGGCTCGRAWTGVPRGGRGAARVQRLPPRGAPAVAGAAGAVELGVVGCRGLLPMRTLRGKGSTDAYAVAKYGPKWARTRTVADSLDPAWNEQYTWPVYDPCTVLTLAVFDESPPSDPDAGPKDPAPSPCSRPMGKVRIRVSTLETDRVYRGSYPLILMLPVAPSAWGRSSSRCASRAREPLRLAAARVSAAHLSRSEPSLRREVVLWMLDAAEPRGFSMRKVRANWHRIVAALAWTADAARWVEDTRNWRNPMATALAHGALVLLAWHPDLLLPVLAVHFTAVGAWRYRRRPQGPVPHPCVRVSMAETADREELDEEFDPVPSTRAAEVVRARYDRLRAVGARVQAMLGDVAAQAERVQALVTWRDPRATECSWRCAWRLQWCFMWSIEADGGGGRVLLPPAPDVSGSDATSGTQLLPAAARAIRAHHITETLASNPQSDEGALQGSKEYCVVHCSLRVTSLSNLFSENKDVNDQMKNVVPFNELETLCRISTLQRPSREKAKISSAVIQQQRAYAYILFNLMVSDEQVIARVRVEALACFPNKMYEENIYRFHHYFMVLIL